MKTISLSAVRAPEERSFLRRAAKRMLLIVIAITAVLPTVGHGDDALAETKPNTVRGKDFEVVIAEAEPVTTNGGAQKGFAVRYRYDFRNQQTVNIKGIGKVPAKGEFSYVVMDEKLTFSPDADATPIDVAIKATRRSEGGGLLEMPAEADFGSASLNETRTAAANFFASISRIFNHEFLSGYRVNQVGESNQYVTTFRALQGIPTNLRAEVAVLVSHSTAAANPPVPFRLQYIVRQKPKRSDKWDYGIAGVEQQVEPFITQLLNRLKTE